MSALFLRGCVLSAGALIASCEERQGTQALVTVQIEGSLAERITLVQTAVVDADGTPVHGVDSIPLRGKGAVELPFTFGAVPADASRLRLVVRALDAVGQTVINQEITALLVSGKATPITLSLAPECVGLGCDVGLLVCELASGAPWTPSCSTRPVAPAADAGSTSPCASADGRCAPDCAWTMDRECLAPNGQYCARDADCRSNQCVAGVCCNDRCQRDCAACNLPGLEGTCSSYVPPASALHCGGCNQACSSKNVDYPHCTIDTCDGTCAEHYDDCDRNMRSNGCETDLRSDPKHCGTCSKVCPFDRCVDGDCKTKAVGYLGGTGEVRRDANRMYGQIVFNTEAATLAGLGIRLNRSDGYPAVRVKVGLYRANTEQYPGQLLRATTEMSSEAYRWEAEGVVSTYGGLEQPVPPYQLEKETFYWLFFIADTTAYVASQEATGSWQETELLPYASIETLPDSLGPFVTSRAPLADLYMITVAE